MDGWSPSIYYTLRKTVSPTSPAYELVKWQEGELAPIDIYTMYLPYRGPLLSFMSCNCPSRSTPCKHWEIAKALVESAPTGYGHLPRLLWQEGCVREAHDIKEGQYL